MATQIQKQQQYKTPALTFDLNYLFSDRINGVPCIDSEMFKRHELKGNDTHIIRDQFHANPARRCFLQTSSTATGAAPFTLATDSYRLNSCAAWRWLLQPEAGDEDTFWFPQPSVLRRLDQVGHITYEKTAQLQDLSISLHSFCLGFDLEAEHHLDLTSWRLPGGEPGLITALQELINLETQPWFVFAYHTKYSGLAECYIHLVHGHVYGSARSWPKYWKICDELDAYALYLITSSLGKATGKQIYTLIKQQLVFSVITRQDQSGGWSHGEWTNTMESHYRLVNGAVLMLAAYCEKQDDQLVRTSLEKAAGFLVDRAQDIEQGAWFMHDSLEGSAQGIQTYLFPWASSAALGKATSNMLALNTHLDSIAALEFYRLVSGYHSYNRQSKSAQTVLKLDTVEWLYRHILQIMDLTLLTEGKALQLPLSVLTINRMGWKYLGPRLHRIKACSPRPIMPNGLIDLALCQKVFSSRYQSVHIWDLARYLDRFPDQALYWLLAKCAEYTQSGPIRSEWKGDASRQDAFGFWLEALYHRCLLDPALKYRDWLADTVIESEGLELKPPPSLLGVNPSQQTMQLSLDKAPAAKLSWFYTSGDILGDVYAITSIAPGSCLRGIATDKSNTAIVTRGDE